MKVLFLSPRQCWPARSGAKLREYHFLRALGQGAEVSYLYFRDPGAAPLSQDDLPFCQEVAGVPKPGAYTIPQLIRGIVGRMPLPVLNYSSPEMIAAVKRVAAKGHFDLIHLDSIHMIGYGSTAVRHSGGGAKLVYNWHNIESEAMRRYSETVSSPPRRWYAQNTAAKLEGLERQMLRTAFGHIVCSERERQQLLQGFPGARVEVVENGVDSQYFAGAGKGAGRRRLVFVGTMDYYPNVQAAMLFVRRIWPEVIKELPGSYLAVVGANPTPEVQALAAVDGVSVTGTVPDIRPYYEDATAAIVPLRSGGGTRLKILEAMAAGVPVISTPLGAEGLAVTPGKDILMADPDDSAAWIEQLTLLDESPARAGQLCGAALDLIRSRYDWETLGTRLRTIYQGWCRSDL